MADPFILSHITRLPLFANCSAPQLDVLAGAFQQVHFHNGELIYRQGENSHALYLFISGSGQVLRSENGSAPTVQGEVKAGEYVGESSLFTTTPRELSVIATAESIVLMLSGAHLEAILRARPDIQDALSGRPRAPIAAAPSPISSPRPPPTTSQATVSQATVPQQPTSTQRSRSFGTQSSASQNPTMGSDAVNSNVGGGEAIILNTHRHSWVFLSKTVRAALLFIGLMILSALASRLPASASFVPLSLCGVGFILPGLMVLYYFLDWRNDYFMLTDQRVIHEEHFLFTGREQRSQMLLESVQNVNLVREGYLAELLNYGNIALTTTGNQPPLMLDRVPNPVAAQRTIFEQVQRVNAPGARADHATTGAAPYPTNSPSPAPTMQNTAPAELHYGRAFFPAMRTIQGTRIIYRKHWIVMFGHIWRPLFGDLVLAILILVRLFVHNAVVDAVSLSVAVVIILVSLAITSFWTLWGYIAWREDVYIIDTEAIVDIVRRPFGLREERMQAGLRQIQNVTSEIKSFWGSIFNEGNVVIQTAADRGQMIFYNVSNPSRVAEEILQRVHQYDSHYRG